MHIKYNHSFYAKLACVTLSTLLIMNLLIFVSWKYFFGKSNFCITITLLYLSSPPPIFSFLLSLPASYLPSPPLLSYLYLLPFFLASSHLSLPLSLSYISHLPQPTISNLPQPSISNLPQPAISNLPQPATSNLPQPFISHLPSSSPSFSPFLRITPPYPTPTPNSHFLFLSHLW